jgi:type I restriction enzyme S subunit
MGQAPPGIECNKDGEGTLFVKAGEFGDLYPIEREWTTKPLKHGKRGDVFICVVGATAGKLNLGTDCAIGRSVAAIRPRPVLETKYLYYQLQPWVLKLRAASAGSAQGVISKKQLAEVPVTVPAIEEQRSIVAEIEKQFSRLDEAVANLKRVKANLKRYKAAVLKAAVEGRLVPTEAELARREGRSYETGTELLQRILETRRSQWKGTGKYGEPASPEAIGLPELPIGWAWATAEQLSTFITKGTTPAAAKFLDGSGDVQFLKVYNLTFDGSLNHAHKPAFVSRATHDGELQRSKVLAGDVLINIVGPPLGQVSVVPPLLVEANINQAIARFRPVPPLSSSFFAHALMTESIMRWAIARAKTTAGQSNLTLELCRSLPIPLPPLGEQHRVVAEVERRISLVLGVEIEVEANLRRSQSLRQAALVAAFDCHTLRR